MRLPRPLVGAAAALLAVFAAVAVARAETCTLELKRLDQQSSRNSDYMYRATAPQSIFMQVGKDGVPLGNQGPAAAFKRIVTKEPKYESANPFRGVVKLGSQEFAFALDATPPPPKDEKPDAEKAEKPKTDPATAKLTDQLGKAAAKPPAPPAVVYNRLYFDLNRNGDLTDDTVIEAKPQPPQRVLALARGVGTAVVRPSYAYFLFPRVDLTIDDEGTKMDYSFFLHGTSVSQPDFRYVSMQFSAAAYREGDITLDGKNRRVVLIDYNSNGRFDDEIKINKNVRIDGGRVYTEQGDMLLIDPDPSKPGSPYDVTGSDSRNYVSKLVNIDGKFYDVKISPAGDKLTLEPAATQLGAVKNPNGGFRAMIYGDQGFLKIHGDKDAVIPVPEGEWKLLSYTVDHLAPEEPKKAEEQKADEKKAENKPVAKAAAAPASGLTELSRNLQSLLASPSTAAFNRHSTVTAAGTDAYKPVKVVKGETVVMPFGGPYKPTVTGQLSTDAKKNKVMSLGMTLIGSAGEVCSNLTVNGARPPKPTFTITDSKGKVIEEGSFEYG